MKKSKIFIGSSVEGLNIAYAIQQNLRYNSEITVWDQGVFELSQTTIESLIEVLDKSDFGIFVFSPDDITKIRSEESLAVRDNVIFELGLFIGRLGRKRSFIIIPEGIEFRLPSDLLGIAPGKYETDREDKSFQSATGPACHQIKLAVDKLGPKPQNEPDSTPDNSEQPQKEVGEENKWIDLFFEKKYNEAISELNKLIKQEKDPERKLDFELWVANITWRIDSKTGDELYKKYIQDYPTNPKCYQDYFYTLQNNDLFDEAIIVIDEAIRKIPKSRKDFIPLMAQCLLKIGEDSESIRILESELIQNESPEIYLTLINIIDEQKDLNKTHQLIHNAYLKYPNNENIIKKYAKISYNLNLFEICLYLYDKLTRLNNEKSQYWTLYGNVCLQLDLTNNAMTAYEKGNSLANENAAWIIGNIGNLYNNIGLYEKAIFYLKSAVEKDANSEFAHQRLSASIKNKDEEVTKKTNFIKKGRVDLRNWTFESNNEVIP